MIAQSHPLKVRSRHRELYALAREVTASWVARECGGKG
jgi:hypothetical protein